MAELDQGVGHGAPVLVEHAAVDDEALAEWRALVLARPVLVAGLHRLMAVDGGRKLGRRVLHDAEGLARRALGDREIGRVEARRTGARALGWNEERHWRFLSAQSVRTAATRIATALMRGRALRPISRSFRNGGRRAER